MEGADLLKETFTQFSKLLKERLETRVFTTEDSIRYTFYIALLSSGGTKHTDVILEYPHPAIPSAKVDTIILRTTDRDPVAVEFKYDRENPGATNQNRTQRAAAVMHDVFRLAKVPKSVAGIKYFVYITDAEMAKYFRNPANRLTAFFDITGTTRFALSVSTLQGFPRSFMSRIESQVCDCQVGAVFASDLPMNHHIRVFEVWD